MLTAYFIKWFALISFGGITDDPLFVVGDDYMKEDDIDVHNVLGLSLSTHVGADGTVVFCNSRSCNQMFFHWWFLERLIPFVRRVKEQFHYDPTTPSWLTLDGKYCQILPLLSQEIHDALVAECLICGKPAGSTTEITQLWDTWKLFCTLKTVLRSIRMDLKANTPVHQRLRDVLKQHETKVGVKHAAHHSRMFIHGLESVVEALRRTVRCSVIEESFAKSGIYPYSPNVILAECTADLSVEEILHILSVIPDLAKILLSKGDISESDFDKFGVRNNENSFKDNYCISRRRGVIMTNIKVFQKERDKVLAKRMREANEISRKARKQAASYKKQRVESNLAVEPLEEEPLVLYLRLPFNSTTTP